MTLKFVSREELEASLAALKDWGSRVSTQPSRHVWSVLPLKHAGTIAGGSIEYSEELDRLFMDRYFKLRSGDRPYFDPFSMTWLQEGYYHSNLATSRKKTFNNSWKAGSLADGRQSLESNYAQIFRDKALTKSGILTLVPAFACALWFYKRPSFEWPEGHAFSGGLNGVGGVLEQFREDFGFGDDGEWGAIFDEASPLDEELRDMWS